MFSQIFSVKTSFWKYFLRVKLAESTTFPTSGFEFKVEDLGFKNCWVKIFSPNCFKKCKLLLTNILFDRNSFIFLNSIFSLQYSLVPTIWRNAQFQHGTMVSYKTKWRNLTCRNPKQSCPRGICKCDKAMAICVRDVLESGGQCPKKFGLGNVFGVVKKLRRSLKKTKLWPLVSLLNKPLLT